MPQITSVSIRTKVTTIYFCFSRTVLFFVSLYGGNPPNPAYRVNTKNCCNCIRLFRGYGLIWEDYFSTKVFTHAMEALNYEKSEMNNGLNIRYHLRTF